MPKSSHRALQSLVTSVNKKSSFISVCTTTCNASSRRLRISSSSSFAAVSESFIKNFTSVTSDSKGNVVLPSLSSNNNISIINSRQSMRRSMVLLSSSTLISPLLLLLASSNAFVSPSFLNKKNYSTSCSMSESTTSKTTTTTPTDNQSNDASGAATTTTSDAGVFGKVASRLQNSWIRDLSPETPENLEKSLQEASREYGDKILKAASNNKFKRPVYNGHYVLVEPTGITDPRLILYSQDVAHNLLQLTEEEVSSNDFIQWVSGNLQLQESWATPYALSIMGKRYTSNCPYGTGVGYGDGRAISIGELNSHEIQLKGSGTTPFCRGADGRAVLRSSIREFLASEAAHYLQVPTTRALSLVVSNVDTVNRPWYSDGTKLELPSMDDPRLAKYTVEEKKVLLSQIREANRGDPNIMIPNPVAITTRVASSFTRIGHVDLYARRVNELKSNKNNNDDDKSVRVWEELQQIIWHACYREYHDLAYQPYIGTKDIHSAATVLLQQSAMNIAKMIAHWIRVGFVQGNFNADNCLVGGKTMDYGPFGYVDEYNPVAAKWTGSGEHFGFLNQPSAGLANYQILVESVAPVLRDGNNNNDKSNDGSVVEEFMEKASNIFQNAVDETFRLKFGFVATNESGDTIWKLVEPLIRSSRTDWTVFFRSLSYTVRDFFPLFVEKNSVEDDKKLYEQMLAALEGIHNSEGTTYSVNDYPGAFYEPLTNNQRKEWIQWIQKWREALIESNRTSDEIYVSMIQTNPKYILREVMLVDAYTNAENNDETELYNLYQLIQHPYDEGTADEIKKYYKRAPDEALVAGGTAFMSCSS